MNIITDSNVLVRAVLQDQQHQAKVAADLLREAELIAIPLPCLCEFTWILQRCAKLPPADIAQSLRDLLSIDKVMLNRLAVEAGLFVLEQGGDFANGVMAFEGRMLGGEVFCSFDKHATQWLSHQRVKVKTLD